MAEEEVPVPVAAAKGEHNVSIVLSYMDDEHEKAAMEDSGDWDGVEDNKEAIAHTQGNQWAFGDIVKAMESEDPCMVLNNALFVSGCYDA